MTEAVGLRKDQRKRKEAEQLGVRRRFALVLLLGLVALISVVLLRGVLSPVPAVLYAAAFVLFMIPGLLLTGLIEDANLSGMARLPLAFVFSSGVFGLLGVPALVLHVSSDTYLWVCGAVLAISLVFAALGAVGLWGPAGNDIAPSRAGFSIDPLWIPFVLLAGVLAFAAAATEPGVEDDAWIYLATVQELTDAQAMASTDPYFGGEAQDSAQLLMDGWLLEQATLSRVAGIDPVALTFTYLAPTLVVVALLAVYALARMLVKSESAGLLTGCVLALLFAASLGANYIDSLLTPGGEFTGRITEDKYVVRFISLPAGLAVAALYLGEPRKRYLGLFALACLSAAVVHPVGFILLGACAAGFGVVHLAVGRRGAWKPVASLAAVILGIGLPPLAYLLATGNKYLSRSESSDTFEVQGLARILEYQGSLLGVGDSYIVHPALVLNPAVLAAYVLGVPFLIWRLKSSLAARLLLAVMVLTPLVVFVPPIADPVGAAIGPLVLPRLSWPIPLAAVLVLGWMAWEVLAYAGTFFERSRFGGVLGALLPLLVVIPLMVWAAPSAAAGLRSVDVSGETPQGESTCSDPVYPWLAREISSPSTVLGDDLRNNSCIMGYAAEANVLSYRGQSQSGRTGPEDDIRKFFTVSLLGEEEIQTLEKNEVDYVMLREGTSLERELGLLPDAFTALEAPGDRYSVYRVEDLESIDTRGALISANTLVNDQKLIQAIQTYEEAVTEAEDVNARLLVNLGLERALVKVGEIPGAISIMESAVEISPEDVDARALLAKLRAQSGEDAAGAREEFERAVDVAPDNVDLRLEYASFLERADPRAATDQYRAVVELYPNVPAYRVQLATSFLLAGEPEAADAQFAEALRLKPLSAGLHADVAQANQGERVRRSPAAALPYYERALELEPNNQFYALEAGRIHAQLSTEDGRDETHFEQAEALLESVENLDHLPYDPDRRASAQLALAELYAAWDRPQDADAARQRATEFEPAEGGGTTPANTGGE